MKDIAEPTYIFKLRETLASDDNNVTVNTTNLSVDLTSALRTMKTSY